MRRKRAIVVDDSRVARRMLSELLDADPGIEVVGTCGTTREAEELIHRLSPDVLTLDIGLPDEDGISFLRRLMSDRPMPVVIVSALTGTGGQLAWQAMQCGAVEVVRKPNREAPWEVVGAQLVGIVRAAADIPRTMLRRLEGRRQPLPETDNADRRLIAIGASTGGPDALRVLLSPLPRTVPGIVVVQHMPAEFTATLAHGLNQSCALEVTEAGHGDRVRPGRVLIAPGGRHMTVRRDGSGFCTLLHNDPPVNGHRPAVDVLLRSVAEQARSDAVGVILTGMGSDGAEGLSAMCAAGARTIAQSKDSCVVFGMPRAALERGAASRATPLHSIAAEMLGARHPV